MIDIIVPGVPLAWKAPYVGTRGAFSPRYHACQIIKDIIRKQYKGEILDIAICVDMDFYMPIPKSTSQKKKIMMICGHLRPEGTPDRINLGKLYEDCLQGIVIKKDSRIVDGRVAKFYGEVPRTHIRINPA